MDIKDVVVMINKWFGVKFLMWFFIVISVVVLLKIIVFMVVKFLIWGSLVIFEISFLIYLILKGKI